MKVTIELTTTQLIKAAALVNVPDTEFEKLIPLIDGTDTVDLTPWLGEKDEDASIRLMISMAALAVLAEKLEND